MQFNPPKAAYIHIPFCISKCSYCDFSSFPDLLYIADDYISALKKEISKYADKIHNKILLTSVYFGGGTPTILNADHLAGILSTINASFGLDKDSEITVEANPGTVDYEKLSILKSAGFNRISIGFQSFDDSQLKILGRAHGRAAALEAYNNARKAGFNNISIDLMFLLPGQNIDNWNEQLCKAISLKPEHISLYELSIEEGTRFGEMLNSGKLQPQNEDAGADMYELAIKALTDAGYEHYEVSNFALPGYRSRHNQVYWRNEPYYAFGAGATSFVNGDRSRRVSSPVDYINEIMAGKDAFDFTEHLTGKTACSETVMLGLRMLDGIDVSAKCPGRGESIAKLFETEISDLKQRGFVKLNGNKLSVTHQGLLLLNEVAQSFMTSK